jgi:hypothetical protein
MYELRVRHTLTSYTNILGVDERRFHASRHNAIHTCASSGYADKHIYHPDLENLVFECLSYKPNDRPQINELL